MPSNFVIVIGRQFGSGGRRIGKLIAGSLGISYYDTELIRKAAESEGVSTEIFRERDEKKPSVLKALLQGLYGIPDNFHTVPISGERIYNVQGKVIKDIVERGSCVIVGRSADIILRDHPRLLSVFLHAPLEYRVGRILERKEARDEEEARELAVRHDRRRESYYNYFAGDKKWGIATNYHLSLDTSLLSDSEIADLIVKLIEKEQR